MLWHFVHEVLEPITIRHVLLLAMRRGLLLLLRPLVVEVDVGAVHRGDLALGHSLLRVVLLLS